MRHALGYDCNLQATIRGSSICRGQQLARSVASFPKSNTESVISLDNVYAFFLFIIKLMYHYFNSLQYLRKINVS
jgi:hypothetical protein